MSWEEREREGGGNTLKKGSESQGVKNCRWRRREMEKKESKSSIHVTFFTRVEDRGLNVGWVSKATECC